VLYWSLWTFIFYWSLWTVTGPLFDLLDLLVFSCSPNFWQIPPAGIAMRGPTPPSSSRICPTGAHVTPLGGGRRLAVTVTSLAGGSPLTVTGPLFRFACLARFHLFTCYAHVRFECFQQTSTHHNRVDGRAYFSSTFVRLTLGGYNHGVVMRSSLSLNTGTDVNSREQG
jgi:hypothetical protein